MLTESQIARLMDVGLVACRRGLVAEARTIFDGLLENRPDFAPALIGRGMSHLVVDDFEAARRILRGVLDQNPGDSDARVMLGLNEILSDRPIEARALLDPLADESGPAADLARGLLECL